MKGKVGYFPLDSYFDTDLKAYTRPVHFDAQDPILREGDHPNCLYYLEKGRAKLFLTHADGKSSFIDFLTAPCFIGEMEMLHSEASANGVTALTDCDGYAIDLSKCREQILNDTRFLRFLCDFLSEKAMRNTRNYVRNQSYSLEVRLAQFILMTSIRGIYREKHTETAEYLGVTYRHLLYVLAEFCKRGLVEKTRQGYRIMDEAALRQIVEEKTGKE